jgi:hypothetical protein
MAQGAAGAAAASDWTWRNIIALIALVATICGAAVLTSLAWWLLDQLLVLARALIAELVRDRSAGPRSAPRSPPSSTA